MHEARRIGISSFPTLFYVVGVVAQIISASQVGLGSSEKHFKDFGKSKRGMVLWQNSCIALIWVVWRERNVKIFEDKVRNSENLWDSIHFLTSLWAFCSVVFKGIPLNVLQLDWLAVCSSNGTVQSREIVRSFLSVVSCYLFVLFSFISSGRIHHPSIVLFFLSIYTCCFLSKKKKFI